MAAPAPGDSVATQGYKASMNTMMEAMPAFTGDADIDFMKQMRGHHVAAVSMARVELAQGKDAQARNLAQEVITAQEREITLIDAWLAQKGASAAPPPDREISAPRPDRQTCEIGQLSTSWPKSMVSTESIAQRPLNSAVATLRSFRRQSSKIRSSPMPELPHPQTSGLEHFHISTNLEIWKPKFRFSLSPPWRNRRGWRRFASSCVTNPMVCRPVTSPTIW